MQQSDNFYEILTKILNFIEERAEEKARDCGVVFLKVRRIFREYRMKYPSEHIHINWIAMAFGILHRQGKIRRWKGKVWKWIG